MKHAETLYATVCTSTTRTKSLSCLLLLPSTSGSSLLSSAALTNLINQKVISSVTMTKKHLECSGKPSELIKMLMQYKLKLWLTFHSSCLSKQQWADVTRAPVKEGWRKAEGARSKKEMARRDDHTSAMSHLTCLLKLLSTAARENRKKSVAFSGLRAQAQL